MDLKLHDIVIMKKPHPCGCKEFELLRLGVDYKHSVIRFTANAPLPFAAKSKALFTAANARIFPADF